MCYIKDRVNTELSSLKVKPIVSDNYSGATGFSFARYESNTFYLKF